MSYSFIIQKDLPLISWSLDDASLSVGSPVESSGYANNFIGTTTPTSGTYNCSAYRKSIPFIHGSNQSVVIPNNGTGGYALKIPAMGFATKKYANDPMTLEFWIKPIDNFGSENMERLVGKPNSQTGIYLHKSSVIAVIGDQFENKNKIVVPVDNMNKAMHIVFVYADTNASLFVNGNGYSIRLNENILTNSYSGVSDPNDSFLFYHFGKDYALDNIAIYAYDMTMLTARKHMVYGLGYEVPDSLAENFGGYRYNLSLARNSVFNKIEKYDSNSWMINSEVDNVVVEEGKLRINNLPEPKVLCTQNLSNDSVFSWNATHGLMITTDGGFIEINPNQIDASNKGFAAVFSKTSAQSLPSVGDKSTLMVLQDPIKNEYFLKIFIERTSNGEDIKYQINNNISVNLLSVSGGINSRFAVGYFYDIQNDNIKVYASLSSGTSNVITFSNPNLFPFSYTSNLRIGTNDSFSERDSSTSIPSLDFERFRGGVIKLVALSTAVNESSIYSDISNRVEKYAAKVDVDSSYLLYREKRFVVSAYGRLSFSIDAKRISGTGGIIGPHRCEWGYDGPEVTVTASPIGFDGESNWFTSEVINNRKSISGIVGKSSGDTKGINIDMEIVCSDVVHNPTIIPFFRLIAIETKTDSTSEIVCSGPNISISFPSGKEGVLLPEYKETPFFWTEESGGLFVSDTAIIDYNQATVSGDDLESGISAISFFINIPDTSSRTIFKVSKGASSETISFNGSTYSSSNANTKIYVNGSLSYTFRAGEWQHIVIVFANRFTITESSGVLYSPQLSFGVSSSKSDFYIDEIMTMDGDATDGVTSISQEEAEIIYKIYTGSYFERITVPTVNNIYFVDSETSISETEGFGILQPIFDQEKIVPDVNIASYTSFNSAAGVLETISGGYRFKYTSSSRLVLDGIYLEDGDRILLKNQTDSSQNGIFVVDFADDMIPNQSYVTLTRVSDSIGDILYCIDGVSNKGKYFHKDSTGNWVESYIIKKVDSYSYEGSREKTDIVAKTFIDI